MRRRLTVASLLALLLAPAAAWAQDTGRIDALLHALRVAPNAEVAAMIEQRVRQLWTEAGSPAAVLLEQRGVRDIGNHADRDALKALDAALVIDPNFALAYAGRAEARLLAGDAGGAVADIEAALKHDPRLFIVFDTLSRIAEAQGDWQAALLAWRRYAAADPKGPGVQMRLRQLERKAVGVKS